MKQVTAHPFVDLVSAELSRARDLHPKTYNSAHEAYGVLAEEMAEFFDEVRKNGKCRDSVAMLAELVQIATVAQRAAEDLGLCPEEEHRP